MNTTKIFNLNGYRGSVAFLAMASLALATTPASAQDYTSWEWEPDEGVHEEEWYDPSDWFDDESYDDYNIETIDYEHGEGAYDAYYDGYYDAYYDDEFGYDWWDADWDDDYKTSYTEGYYDGYYDAAADYEYDPLYYVVSYVDADRDYDRNRDRDDKRERADRRSDAQNMTGRERRKVAESDRQEKRIRGTVERMQRKRNVGPKDHLVYMIRFDDGDMMHVDLGPKMTKDRVPVESGDRVTFIGDPVRKDETKVLLVKRMVHDGDTITLRGSDQSQSMNNRSERRSERNRDSNRR